MEKAMTGHCVNDQSTFDLDKAIAVIGYFAAQTKESMYSLMKLMYLSDKLHLEKCGRFIVGDHYCAMQNGPVPSATYDMFKHLKGQKPNARFEPAEGAFKYTGENDHEVTLLKPFDLDELSSIEIKCLNEILAVYHSLGKWGVRDLSHDPTWRKAWETRHGLSASISTEEIASEFDDGNVVLNHLRDPFPGEAELHQGKPATAHRS